MSRATALSAVATLDVPEAGPLDKFTRVRITAMLRGYFGDIATLEAHVTLLDTRGAWYAEQVMGAWSDRQPDAFFGLVAHVVRTQLAGPAPQPDLDRWISDGRPADPGLGARWDQVRELKNLDGSQRPLRVRGGLPGDSPIGTSLDDTVAAWPEEHWEKFLLAYLKLDLTLARRGVALPPIGT